MSLIPQPLFVPEGTSRFVLPAINVYRVFVKELFPERLKFLRFGPLLLDILL